MRNAYYSLMDDESFELSNRIEEPDTKISKKSTKIKIGFSDLFGVGCAGKQVSSCFFLIQMSLFFFENVSHRVKFGTFFEGLVTKCIFGWWKFKKIMEI
jgi:hypothetical protein